MRAMTGGYIRYIFAASYKRLYSTNPSTAHPNKPIPSEDIKNILSFYYLHIVGESYIDRQDNHITLSSKLSINHPWYCNSTGHLNAVELNLAFNQMMYVAIYFGISKSWIPQLQHIPLDRYMDKAWPDFLITDIRSTFNRPLHSDDFSGTLRIKSISANASNKHLFFQLDLSAHSSSNEFPTPGKQADAYSEMHLAVKNYRSITPAI